MTRLLALSLLVPLAGCDRRPDDVPVVVSAIGGQVRLDRPERGALAHPSATLLGATAQGLVRFDANGRVEPGLAERWIVIEDGRSYIFRLRRAEWANGGRVTARQVVAALRRAVARDPRGSLGRHLTAIDEIVEMTPDVIEIRLNRPRPDLLTLFAQPELAIFEGRRRGGTGPFRIQRADADGILLRPAFDPSRLADSEFEEPEAAQYVLLRAERAAMAIARFDARQSDMVSGGTFREWPLLAQAQIAPANRRIDPAQGLFGLSIAARTGFLSTPANREAIAMAIDRTALTRALTNDWPVAEALLPEQFDSAAAPAQPGWQPFTLEERRVAAALRVEQWRAANDGARPLLRIALPTGPGANLIWGHLVASLAAIGVRAERVALRAPADLRLFDRVAPHDSARWYLVNACQPCAGEVAALIVAARDAPDAASRRQRLAEADAAIAADVAFLPLARPLRWSLVALRLRDWRANPRAVHPLNHLRGDPR